MRKTTTDLGKITKLPFQGNLLLDAREEYFI